MKTFADLGIRPLNKNFTGDKIKIERLLNREIVVHDFKIVDSKFQKGSNKCLHISLAISETRYVCFTGSGVLMEMISQVPKDAFPIRATIVKENEHFEFR